MPQDMCVEDGPTEAELEESGLEESRRLSCVDRPIESDPWGNGIVGAVAGGAASAATGLGSVLGAALSGTGLARLIAIEPFLPDTKADEDAERFRCAPYVNQY